jgi:GMP synthase (glutamine-hydrolysing)
MNHQTIAVLDFGSQYTQVIARRIRECNVHSQIYPFSTPVSVLKKAGVCGVILSGGPASVLGKNAPLPDHRVFCLGVPVLGICYGLQLIAHMLGGKVEKSLRREYGHSVLEIGKGGDLLAALPKTLRVWNSHGDKVIELPKGFVATAKTTNSDYAAIEDREKRFFGLQFHPEVSHSEHGILVLENFIKTICHCEGDWSMANYLDQSVAAIRREVGDSRVVLGLSGGVDSSVAAALIHKAIGDQLVCVFVDNGLLRLHEREAVVNLFKRNFKMNLHVVRASGLFLEKLKGVTDPERKRKIIGFTFIKVFEDFIKKHGQADFLAQGTLYPDVIESIAIDGNPAAVIKSHHNVGGLPKRMKMKILEPLRELFKDEVRTLGVELGLPREVLWRQPFPGPGLGVRILGDINRRNLTILRQADAILQEEMVAADYYYKVWQSFAVFLPVRTVGVMGDQRTYDNVIALRVVESLDAMTADWVHLPHELLQRISTRIINEVKGVNRVVLDISSKPPSTIEWE